MCLICNHAALYDSGLRILATVQILECCIGIRSNAASAFFFVQMQPIHRFRIAEISFYKIFLSRINDSLSFFKYRMRNLCLKMHIILLFFLILFNIQNCSLKTKYFVVTTITITTTATKLKSWVTQIFPVVFKTRITNILLDTRVHSQTFYIFIGQEIMHVLTKISSNQCVSETNYLRKLESLYSKLKRINF